MYQQLLDRNIKRGDTLDIYVKDTISADWLSWEEKKRKEGRRSTKGQGNP